MKTLSKSKLRKRKRELRDFITPDDKIATILYFVFQPGIKLLLDVEILHTKVFEFCQRKVYSDLMGNELLRSFADTYPFPTSDLLDRIIMRMRIARLIFWTMDYYFMNNKQLKSVSKGTLPKFSNSEVELFKGMGEELRQALNLKTRRKNEIFNFKSPVYGFSPLTNCY